MDDISNRTLALFLVAAIVVSAGGALIALQSTNNYGPTGFAVEGQVNLTVGETLAISLTDGSINFGECTLIPGTFTYVDSSQNNTQVNNSVCSLNAGWNSTGSDFIQVWNYGNVDANVTLTSDHTSISFFTGDDDDSTIKYWTVNNVSCTDPQTTRLELNSTSTNFTVCNNLLKSVGKVNLYVDANMSYKVTSTATTTTLTFLAEEAGV